MTATSSAAADGVGDAGGGRHLARPHDTGGERGALDLAAVIALEEPARDGRVARGQRTRRAVAEALMELLRAGDPDPTAKAVARRAGVSLRLVFHHFADMDDLYQFAATLQLRRQWADLPQLSPGLALPTRIERTVAHRAALFEEISAGPARPGVPGTDVSRALRRAIGAADSLLLEDLKAHVRPRAGGAAGRALEPSISAPWTPAPRGRPGNACARRRASRSVGPGA